MKRSTSLLAAGFVCALAAAVSAQEPAATRLSLDQCVAAARARNARPKAAAQSTVIAEARLGQAKSSRYPEVSAKLALSRFDEDPNFLFPASAIVVPASVMQIPPTAVTLPPNAFGPGFPPVPVQVPVPGQAFPIPAQVFPIPEQNIRLMDRTLLTGSLHAMYAVYTGGLAGARIAQARAGVAAAGHERRQADADLVFDVNRAYWGVVLARKLRATAGETHERMKVTLELTESLYKTGSGRVKKTDFLRHSAMVHTLASMVAEFEAQERTAVAALAMLIGWDRPGDPDVRDEDFPAAGGPVDTPARLRDILASNPQIGRVQAGIDASQAEVRAARAGHLPKVGLFADLNLIGNSYDKGAVTPTNKTAWAVGVGVEVPIFQGFRVARAVSEARAAQKQLEWQQAALRDGIAFEVRRTALAIEKARAQVTSAGEAYRAATENRDLHVRAYQDELVETKDMIESQLVEAVLAGQFFKVQYDLLESLASLEKLAALVR